MRHSIFLRSSAPVLGLTSLFLLSSCATKPASAQPISDVEALVYSTMPSTRAHSPAMAMDGNMGTYFKSVYGMSGGDDVMILLSRPITVTSMKVVTGDDKNQDGLTNGYIETSLDGKTFVKAANFNAQGVAQTTAPINNVRAVRLKLDARRGLSSLMVREISIQSPTPITHVQRGPGRPFSDYSQAPDLAGWANEADKKMESFWGECESLLYSPNFISPNAINVIYTTGPNVTPVAATGGGVMTVNTAWCHAHPEDTGLTVHEMSHAIQAYSGYNPVWLVEGIADYTRWIAYEPENYKVNINADKAKYSDSYRTTGTFLAWLQLNYDSHIVTKLSNNIRFGTYNVDDFKTYTGKDVDTLWSEFLVALRKDPQALITPPVPLAQQPRVLPAVAPGASVPVDIAKAYDTLGYTKNGGQFAEDAGFDAGGAAFSGDLLNAMAPTNNVRFALKQGTGPNTISSNGNVIALPRGRYSALYLLGAAVEGNQMNQTLTVSYTDGTMQKLYQNFSDWFTPQNFVGETRAAKMDYRNMANGDRDPRTFYAYSYGFPLDATKEVASVTLPRNPNIKIMGVSLAK